MSIKTIIWDVGGVLVRTENLRPRELLAIRLGLTRQALERHIFEGELGRRGQLGEIEGRAYWEKTGALFDLGYDEFMQTFFGGDQFDHELLASIRGLKNHYKIGLLSNAFSDMREWVAGVEGFVETFDVMVISAEEGVMKPDAAIYTRALDRLAVEPHEAVFIDDSPANIEGAQAVGMHAILFRNREQSLADLDALLEQG